MQYVGDDDARSLRLYSNSEAIPAKNGEPEIKAGTLYFLKTAVGEYVRVQ